MPQWELSGYRREILLRLPERLSANTSTHRRSGMPETECAVRQRRRFRSARLPENGIVDLKTNKCYQCREGFERDTDKLSPHRRLFQRLCRRLQSNFQCRMSSLVAADQSSRLSRRSEPLKDSETCIRQPCRTGLEIDERGPPAPRGLRSLVKPDPNPSKGASTFLTTNPSRIFENTTETIVAAASSQSAKRVIADAPPAFGPLAFRGFRRRGRLPSKRRYPYKSGKLNAVVMRGEVIPAHQTFSSLDDIFRSDSAFVSFLRDAILCNTP